jgi:hypothetical protein
MRTSGNGKMQIPSMLPAVVKPLFTLFSFLYSFL